MELLRPRFPNYKCVSAFKTSSIILYAKGRASERGAVCADKCLCLMSHCSPPCSTSLCFHCPPSHPHSGVVYFHKSLTCGHIPAERFRLIVNCPEESMQELWIRGLVLLWHGRLAKEPFYLCHHY
eukprot:505572-Amphidinium_carterae.4